MDFECRRIDLVHIDAEDATFRISTGGMTGRIRGAIAHLGAIHPPLLLHKSADKDADRYYIIVSGFARIEACRQLGRRTVDAFCLSSDTPFHRCAMAAIADNLHRPLNPVEMARAFGLIETSGAHGEEIQRFLADMGFHINAELASKLRKISTMSSGLQRGLTEGSIALPTALALHEIADRAGAEALVEFFMQLPMSLNRQRETLDWIEAIMHREQCDVTEILSDALQGHDMADAACDRPRAANLVRAYLKKRRYPEITAYEENFAQMAKQLKLPKGIQLIPPPHFEQPTYGLRIDFATQEELNARLDNVHRLGSSPALAHLLGQLPFES